MSRQGFDNSNSGMLRQRKDGTYAGPMEFEDGLNHYAQLKLGAQGGEHQLTVLKRLKDQTPGKEVVATGHIKGIKPGTPFVHASSGNESTLVARGSLIRGKGKKAVELPIVMWRVVRKAEGDSFFQIKEDTRGAGEVPAEL